MAQPVPHSAAWSHLTKLRLQLRLQRRRLRRSKGSADLQGTAEQDAASPRRVSAHALRDAAAAQTKQPQGSPQAAAAQGGGCAASWQPCWLPSVHHLRSRRAARAARRRCGARQRTRGGEYRRPAHRGGRAAQRGTNRSRMGTEVKRLSGGVSSRLPAHDGFSSAARGANSVSAGSCGGGVAFATLSSRSSM